MESTAQDWGASGLAYLTGPRDGQADFSRAEVLQHARGVAAEVSERLGVDVDAATLLAGRAAQLGLARAGPVSAGGATRLLATRAGWCALTLSRPDDVAAVPALLQSRAAPDDAWSAVRRWAGTRTPAEVVGRARLLGLPAAALGEAVPGEPVVRRIGATAPPRPPTDLLVVDMSSMWAGPLCGQLLAWAGATVVKVETHRRPDGTRAGPRSFFDWMNGGKLSYAADFDDPGRLRELLAVADVVIESSRPAALIRRGLGPREGPARDGRVWLRITGHGADVDHAAFGDDAAVAGGLVGRGDVGPVFCGDAIADPLTGLAGALAVVRSLAAGGGHLIDVVLAAVAATYAALPEGSTASAWPALPPLPPAVALSATPLGTDNARVERLIAERNLAPC